MRATPPTSASGKHSLILAGVSLTMLIVAALLMASSSSPVRVIGIAFATISVPSVVSWGPINRALRSHRTARNSLEFMRGSEALKRQRPRLPRLPEQFDNDSADAGWNLDIPEARVRMAARYRRMSPEEQWLAAAADEGPDQGHDVDNETDPQRQGTGAARSTSESR